MNTATQTHLLDSPLAQSQLQNWLAHIESWPPVERSRADRSEPPRIDADALLPNGERYTPGEEVARGGMGAILLARDNRLGRTVAMKRLLSATPRADELKRFLLEAQVTGQLDHPNIVHVHDVGIDAEGRPYFTMPYVRGEETLRSVIEKLREGDLEYHRRYTMERRVQIMLQVCHAVEFAHQRGVIHRDIKPDNVMVGPCGEVLLLDWGLARVGAAEASSPPRAVQPVIDPHQTDSDSVLGTPFYMSPEQLTDVVSPRSDVYSLAAVLTELLGLQHYLGEPAWEFKELARQILRQPPVSPDAEFDPLNGRVPMALARICTQGLAKDPALRPSAAEMAEQLQRWLEGGAPCVCPNSLVLRGLDRWRRVLQNHPRPATLATLAAVLIFLVGLIGSVVAGLRLLE